ncbi:MAG: hypothetical protein H7336_01060 [Bacteriovorax sp.]|nr:hypothetical protein [Bacteriovorax sp.]
MKLLIVLCALISSIAAFAGDRNTAYEVVCKNLPFESDRNKCIKTIKPFSYFNDEALSICPSFPFATNQLLCLQYIGDKRYEPYEVEACKNTPFDTEKLRCLSDNGSQSTGGTCVSTRELIDQLMQAQNEIRTGSTGTADKRLTYLINKLQSCPF